MDVHLRYDLRHYMLQAVTFQSNIPNPLGRRCGKFLSSFCDSSVLQLQNVNTSKHLYHQIAVFIVTYNWNLTPSHQHPASTIWKKGWTYVLQTTLKITHLICSCCHVHHLQIPMWNHLQNLWISGRIWSKCSQNFTFGLSIFPKLAWEIAEIIKEHVTNALRPCHQ